MHSFNVKFYKNVTSDVQISKQQCNQYNIVVVLHAEDFDANETMLIKIFEALGISLKEDVMLLKVKYNEIFSLDDWKENKQIIMLVFGVKLEQFAIQAIIHENLPSKIANFIFLKSESLSEIALSVDKKKKLWTSLQEIFKSWISPK